MRRTQARTGRRRFTQPTIKINLLKAEACSDVFLQLRRNVICEACLGAAVVAIVACLGVTPPARYP